MTASPFSANGAKVGGDGEEDNFEKLNQSARRNDTKLTSVKARH